MSDPYVVLAEVQQRADAATDGPWGVVTDGDELTGAEFPYAIHTPTHDPWNISASPEADICDAAKPDDYFHHQRSEISQFSMDDAEFIAAARTDVPRLVKALTDVLDKCDRATDRSGPNMAYCEGLNDAADAIRGTITAALAGEY